MVETANTIGKLLQRAPRDAPAISAPGGRVLDYGGLGALVSRLSGALAQAGIGAGDKVAIVLPNGPAAATAFLAVANRATAAPLNPAYTRDEYAFYLEDLKARLLITDDDTGAAAEAARALGIPVSLARETAGAPAGEFALDLAEGAPLALDAASPDDVALVLHTSGTTSRPKLVPLTHRNVTSSAANIARTLELGPDDICLNVMPLFHIHGLIAAVLASLSAGGSICCTPGFNALKFYGWLDEVGPSWYTAVPTMHQAIVARAARNADSVARARLRFVRSSSSSLPPQVMTEIEATFGCPLVEAYGMTEAAHQMASNPIAPGAQKTGSVGLPAGPEIGILTEEGVTQDPETLGEIVISGENVTPGYEANPKANAENFIPGGPFGDRWFRTGDQGKFDADGYLYVTGRLKEIINRGGEKISPREVDEVLMDHPAVEQAVCFAVPHKQLGEDVAAAIRLKEGERADESSLRAFAAERLAAFKVPRKVLILDEIPKGATGKLVRIGLAEKLGLGEG